MKSRIPTPETATKLQSDARTRENGSARRTPAERAEILGQVLSAMCEGHSVREMAGELGVPRSRLMEWLLSEPYRDQYARAREEQGRALAEEAIDLAKQATPKTANAVRVTVDTLKWAAGRMAPRDYGDRLEVRAGSLPSLDMTQLSDAQVARIAAGEHPLAVLGTIPVSVAASPADSTPPREGPAPSHIGVRGV